MNASAVTSSPVTVRTRPTATRAKVLGSFRRTEKSILHAETFISHLLVSFHISFPEKFPPPLRSRKRKKKTKQKTQQQLAHHRGAGVRQANASGGGLQDGAEAIQQHR